MRQGLPAGHQASALLLYKVIVAQDPADVALAARELRRWRNLEPLRPQRPLTVIAAAEAAEIADRSTAPASLSPR